MDDIGNKGLNRLKPEEKIKMPVSVSVLIVEDSPTQVEKLKYILEQEGYQITSASNGKQALLSLKTFKPNLIISDIVMPEMDGYELCRIIKADEKLKEIPVILLTAMTEPEYIIKGLQCGADHFVTKPYEKDNLLSHIQYVLSNKELRRKQKMGITLDFIIGGKQYSVNSDRLQLLDCLISTYETAFQQNAELTKVQRELRQLNQHLDEAVVERVKELSCVYSIDRLGTSNELTLNEIFQKVVSVLKESWRYPEITEAMITFRNKKFMTKNYRDTDWQQSSIIQTSEGRLGEVKVVYLEKRPELDEGTFTKEERQLVNSVADQLARIVESREAHEALKASEQNFHNSLDSLFVGIRITTSDGYTLYANQALLEIFGYENIEEVRASPPQNHYTPDSYADYLQRKEQFARGEPLPDELEIDVIRKDGAIRHLQLFNKKVLWDGKEQYQGLYRDITEHQQAEKEKEMSLRILQVLNQSGEKKKLIHKLLELFKEDGKFEAVGIRLHTGDDYPYYETNGFPDKHIRTENRLCAVDDKGKILRDSQNNPILECMCGNIISGRFDSSKSFFTEGGSFWTNSTTNLLATTTEADRLARTCDRCNGEGYESVALIPLKAGNITIGLLQINDTRCNGFTKELIQYYEGLAQSVGIALAQKQAEEALVASEVSYRRLFETSKDGILIQDVATGVVVDVNPFLIELLGFPREELLGKAVWELRCVKDSMAIKDMFMELQNKKYVRYEDLLLETAAGQRVAVEFIANMYEVDQTKVIQCNIRNITERKQAEEEKQQLEDKAQVASRLAAVGEMAAGIAHEINNPLTGVIGFSQMLLETENIPKEIRENVAMIADGSQRVANIVKRLLTFARQTKPVRTMANLNELIENTLKLRDYVLKTGNIDVVTRFDPELPWSVIDPGQLQQVFLNLIVNAEQAMKGAHGRGTLTITTEKKKNNILISFKDDGPGITKENMRQMFQPFFTTKAPGEGTGLGLSLSRSIILEHGGTMKVESESGQGATFIIELPIIESLPSEADTPSPTAKVKPTTMKKGKILVVDDEPAVRALLEKILIQNGHSVDTIDDASKALDKLSAGMNYDVILTDVRMPGMSGKELYARIIEKTPALKGRIIFITGDVMGLDIKAFLAQNNLSYLAKPFDIELLKEKIDTIMNAG